MPISGVIDMGVNSNQDIPKEILYSGKNNRRKNHIIQPIMKDIFFLNQKSEPATQEDKQVALHL